MKKLIVPAVLVLAVGIAGCGGGGGGGGEASSGSTPSGVCEPCIDDGGCEDGLACQACTGSCSPTGNRCTGFSGGGTLRCNGVSFPGGCANIAGTWTLTESVTGSCTAAGDSQPIDESGTGSITFVQNGCDVSYTVPGVNATRRGTIVGNRIRLVGPFLVAADSSVSFSDNQAVVEGTVSDGTLDLSGTGHATGQANGVLISCEGMSTASGSR